MISACSRGRWRTLNDVEPAHLGLAFGHTSLRCKLACVTQCTGNGRKKVCIEREDSFGLLEVVDGVDRLAKGQDRACPNVISVDRLVLVPFRLRKLSKNRFQLPPQ